MSVCHRELSRSYSAEFVVRLSKLVLDEINELRCVFMYGSTSHPVVGRNPAPVEVGSLSPYLPGSVHPRWCRISSINSPTDQQPWENKFFSFKFNIVLTLETTVASET